MLIYSWALCKHTWSSLSFDPVLTPPLVVVAVALVVVVVFLQIPFPLLFLALTFFLKVYLLS